MKLHSLLRYLALSTQYAAESVSQQAARHFLDHFPDGKPDEAEFAVGDERRTLPKSTLRHHRMPGIRNAHFTVKSDVLPGGEVTLADGQDVSERMASIEVPLKRGLLRRASSITIHLELGYDDATEGVQRVNEHYLSHPAPIPPKEN